MLNAETFPITYALLVSRVIDTAKRAQRSQGREAARLRDESRKAAAAVSAIARAKGAEVWKQALA